VFGVFLFLTANGFTAESSHELQEKMGKVQRLESALDKAAKPFPLYGENIKLKIGGEFRYQFEFRNDFDLNDASRDDDLLHLVRTRLDFNLGLGHVLRFFAQGQDAESFAGSGLNRTSANVNRLDLHQLYAELTSPWKEVPLSMTLGRQKLSYGDQRFVGGRDLGALVPRVFDAAKLSYTPVDWFQADAWISQVVLVDRVRPDSADHGENFYGFYTQLHPTRNHELDTFLFVRHDRDNELVGERTGERGQLKEYTLGNRFKGKTGSVDYGTEWAWQFGSRAHDDIKAWALYSDLGYTFVSTPWQPRFDVEFTHGSGDSNPNDGHFENFDNLFPSNELHYGDLGFAGLRNMNSIKLGLGAKPHSAGRANFYH